MKKSNKKPHERSFMNVPDAIQHGWKTTWVEFYNGTMYNIGFFSLLLSNAWNLVLRQILKSENVLYGISEITKQLRTNTFHYSDHDWLGHAKFSFYITNYFSPIPGL